MASKKRTKHIARQARQAKRKVKPAKTRVRARRMVPKALRSAPRPAPKRVSAMSAATVRQIAAEQYGYRIAAKASEAVAGAANVLMGTMRNLGALGLGEVEPPFGYPVLIGEARRIRRRGGQTARL